MPRFNVYRVHRLTEDRGGGCRVRDALSFDPIASDVEPVGYITAPLWSNAVLFTCNGQGPDLKIPKGSANPDKPVILTAGDAVLDARQGRFGLAWEPVVKAKGRGWR